MNKFSDFKIESKLLIGKKIKLEEIVNLSIEVHSFKIVDSKHPREGYEKCLHLQLKHKEDYRVLFTSSNVLIDQIKQVPKDGFPFKCKIVKSGKSLSFTD